MANQQRLLDYSPRDQAGTAAGLLRTAQYTGAALAAAMTSFLLGNHASRQPMQSQAAVLVPLSLLLLAILAIELKRRRGRDANTSS
jgi:sugar phosphate permease